MLDSSLLVKLDFVVWPEETGLRYFLAATHCNTAGNLPNQTNLHRVDAFKSVFFVYGLCAKLTADLHHLASLSGSVQHPHLSPSGGSLTLNASCPFPSIKSLRSHPMLALLANHRATSFKIHLLSSSKNFINQFPGSKCPAVNKNPNTEWKLLHWYFIDCNF